MTRRRARVAGVLAAVAALSFAWAAAIWLNGGGLAVSAGPLRLSSNDISRPLILAAVALGAAVALTGVAGFAGLLRGLGSTAAIGRCAVGLATATTALGLVAGSWTASGPDPFAYVSQAALWRAGQLDIPVPLASSAPWPAALETFVPFGYRHAPDGAAAIVPVTPPGVPLLMAFAQLVGGHPGAFLVTPIFAGILVLATFSIGRRVRSPVAGLVAAWLVATSPAVIFMLMWPMSDIPAAALTALVVLLLLHRSTGAAAGAGLVSSAAILTRQSMVAVLAVVVLWLAVEAVLWRDGTGKRPWSRLLVFALALAPGVALLAWANTRWFGAPWASGYGTAGTLLSMERMGANAARYAWWLAETSPAAYVGLLALALPFTPIWSRAGGQRTAWLLALVAIGTSSVYLVYTTFNDWWYLRFLLPAWPALFVATGVVVDAVASKSRLAAIGCAAVVIGAGVAGLTFVTTHGVFRIGPGERRYANIARLVATSTDPRGVVLTAEHSGTLQYYAGRETLRFDFLDPVWLDRTLEWLMAAGRHPYILVEDWEQPRFEARFGDANREGRLSYSPLVAWQSSRATGWVYLFDPMNKAAVTVHPGAEVERDEPFVASPHDFPRRTELR